MRDESQLFVVEGEKIVEEVLQNSPESVIYCVSIAEYSNSNQANFEWYLTDEETLKKCSSLTTPNKVLAVVKKMNFESTDSAFILALDAVQDPGNMGTIMRMADWYGVQKIVCSKNTVDCYNPKVIQASMGAFLRIEVTYVDLKKYLSETQLPVYGALLEGENVYRQTLRPAGILLMGNEGKGISDELIPMITKPISIPRRGQAESLNVSVATAILLSEFFRLEM